MGIRVEKQDTEERNITQLKFNKLRKQF